MVEEGFREYGIKRINKAKADSCIFQYILVFDLYIVLFALFYQQLYLNGTKESADKKAFNKQHFSFTPLMLMSLFKNYKKQVTITVID